MIYEYFRKSVRLTCAENAVYLCKLGGYWALVYKDKDEKTTLYTLYNYKVVFLTRNILGVRKYLYDIKNSALRKNDDNNFRVFKYIDGVWNYFERPNIEFDSNITGEKQTVINHVKHFLSLGENGKIKNTGVLLYGNPGCGKSYFVCQIASHFGLNVYYMNISEFSSNSAFVKAVMAISFPAILLLEDFDCAVSTLSREQDKKENTLTISVDSQNAGGDEKKSGVGLDTILNVFDGMLTQNNQIIVATTNHIDKIDNAVLRNGRFNIKVELGFLSKKELETFIYNVYNKKVDISCTNIKNVSIADAASYAKQCKLEEFIQEISSV